MDILEADENIDNLVLMTSVMSMFRASEQLEREINLLTELRGRTQKPVAVVLGHYSPDSVNETRGVAERLRDGGVPMFVSVERGARAMRNALDYHRMRPDAG